MIKLRDYMSSPLIKLNTSVSSKKKAIEELVGHLVENKYISKTKFPDICKAILKREALGSTGIGQGVALPHVKCKGIKKIRIVFTNSKDGIEFNSLDGDPVHLIFLLAGPEKSGPEYIKILSQLSQYLNDPYFRRDLVNARTSKEVLEIIKKTEE